MMRSFAQAARRPLTSAALKNHPPSVALSSAASQKQSSVALKLVKGVAGVAALSTVGALGYMYSDEGRWRSAQAMYFFSKLGAAYYGVEDEEKKKTLHLEWSEKSLELCLKLGGYYIKLAQTCVGTGYLPDEYSDKFEVLLDQCPSRDMDVIAKVFEKDVGCTLDEAFATFDTTPIGAGSIGQVHRATLKGSGKPVVVKIQYPGVEEYFRLDFQTMTWLCSFGDFGDAMQEVMDEFAKTMVNEFKYEKEAAFLRQASDNIMPQYGKSVFIPLPIDDAHPDSPTNRSLCTHNVLTMEAVNGVPIKKYLKEMLEEWATSQGKTVDETKVEMKKMYEDPEKMREMLVNSKPASETMTDVYIAGVKAINWIFHTDWKVPLNGPRIIKLLCDVHAHEIFVDGLFNSDPHPGNILQMEDGRLGLIDYGACDVLDHDKREAFARLCVALADKDDPGTIKAFKDFGVSSENNDDRFLLCYAMLCYHRGFHPDDMKRCGIPDDVGPLDLELYLNKFDHIQKMEGPVATTQRCVMVLLGLGQEIGASGVSIATMFRPTAVEYLKSRGKM